MNEDLLLNRYQILKGLGKGGFSEVYKAYDTRMYRVVAIKKIPASRKTAPRALREARTVALLNHPNIVTLYDFEEFEDDYYLVMEYIEGATLAEILNKKSPLSCDQSITIASQICLGLECAHLNGIIHRDIKPENLMLLQDGRVKIMDFGIARLKSSTMTRRGDILGTLAYMSPEQAQGEYVDEATDIFSLGVVLYQMLTGVSPFAAETSGATIFKVLNVDPVPPSRINPEVPRKLDVVVLKALEKDPEARFETATEMRFKLERCRTLRVSPQKLLKPLILVAQREEEEEEIPGGLEQMRERIWSVVGDHAESLKRGIASTVLALSFWLAFQKFPFYPGSITLFLPFIILLFTFLTPSVGIASSFALLFPAIIKYSRSLGILFASFSLIYWLAFSHKKPLTSLVPLFIPIAAHLNLGIVYLFLVSLIFSPPLAACLSGLGCLGLEFYDLFTGQPVLRFTDIPNEYFLFKSLKGLGLTGVLKQLIAPFLRHPFLIYQVTLWSGIGFIMGAMTIKRRFSSSLLSILVGLALLVVGYTWIPTILNIPPVSYGGLMQRLSFSLIMLLILLPLIPFKHIPRKKIWKEGKERLERDFRIQEGE
ncbi:MAG: serine/threonine-protein kinase [Actinomycetota bacterium]|nr:serine/threonine-protein kinase [Actinomycetota bacterium]